MPTQMIMARMMKLKLRKRDTTPGSAIVIATGHSQTQPVQTQVLVPNSLYGVKMHLLLLPLADVLLPIEHTLLDS